MNTRPRRRRSPPPFNLRQMRRQFFRYIVAGSAATLVDIAVLLLLTSGLGWHYLVSNTFSFTTGTLANYLISVYWVFSARTFRNRLLEFVVFAAISMGGLGWSQLCMYGGVEYAGLHYLPAKLVAVAFTLFWNFAAKKVVLFRERAAPDVKLGLEE